MAEHGFVQLSGLPFLQGGDFTQQQLAHPLQPDIHPVVAEVAIEQTGQGLFVLPDLSSIRNGIEGQPFLLKKDEIVADNLKKSLGGFVRGSCRLCIISRLTRTSCQHRFYLGVAVLRLDKTG
ncbi:hypothetical protein D3C75_945140 [compost metagenome]